MFQFPALAPTSLPVTGLQPAGLSHSDIYGSSPVCGPPYLFAAYHVLLRLLKPRHPPSALVTFSLLSEFTFALFSRLPRNCFPAISFKIAELSVAFFYLVIFPNIVNDLARLYGCRRRYIPKAGLSQLQLLPFTLQQAVS